jgi:hypothetical protein
MKQILTVLALIFSFTINAQVFDGVSVSRDLATAVSKFKVKGYKLRKYIENGVIIDGKVGNRNIELFIFVTPKSKKIYKFTLYFEEQTTWSSLKGDYDKYYEIFKEKYGKPDEDYSFFSNPYEAGDGYEMTAVKLEKAIFSAYWFKRENTTIAISISKYKQVEITYENDTNMNLKKKEISVIENSIF